MDTYNIDYISEKGSHFHKINELLKNSKRSSINSSAVIFEITNSKIHDVWYKIFLEYSTRGIPTYFLYQRQFDNTFHLYVCDDSSFTKVKDSNTYTLNFGKKITNYFELNEALLQKKRVKVETDNSVIVPKIDLNHNLLLLI